MEPTTNDSSAACGQSALTAGLERMFSVTEFDHPEHHTHKWTKLECEWINERIRTAIAAEREACATVCEEEICACCWNDEAQAAAEHLADTIRMRSNAALTGATPNGGASG